MLNGPLELSVDVEGLQELFELLVKGVEVVVDERFRKIIQRLGFADFLDPDFDSVLNDFLALGASAFESCVRRSLPEPLDEGLLARRENVNKIPLGPLLGDIFGAFQLDFQNADLALLLDVDHLLFLGAVAFVVVLDVFEELASLDFFLEVLVLPEEVLFAVGLPFSGVRMRAESTWAPASSSSRSI